MSLKFFLSEWLLEGIFIHLLNHIHVSCVCVWPLVILFWFSVRSLKNCIDSKTKIAMT